MQSVGAEKGVESSTTNVYGADPWLQKSNRSSSAHPHCAIAVVL